MVFRNLIQIWRISFWTALRSCHLECAVIVFAGVGGKEIGRVGVAFVMIYAAGQAAEIGIAGEREAICCWLGF